MRSPDPIITSAANPRVRAAIDLRERREREITGRTIVDVTTKAVELAGTVGYSERTLLEKWARDSKILDIFEGTQQIQQLVVARRLLGLSSAELK